MFAVKVPNKIFCLLIKSGCLKISTKGGKYKNFEKSHKNSVHFPRYSINENIILVSSDKYFGDTASVKFGRFTAPAGPLFQGPRQGYEKSSIWI